MIQKIIISLTISAGGACVIILCVCALKLPEGLMLQMTSFQIDQQPLVGSTLSPQMQREAIEYLDNLKREKQSLFAQVLSKLPDSIQGLEQQQLEAAAQLSMQQPVAESMDLPMDLSMCVAPANECNCCNCMLNDEACKIIGDVNDPTR